MTNTEAVQALSKLRKAYRTMPNHGAALQVQNNGYISNGTAIVVAVEGKRNAFDALREAGFVPTPYGFKLAIIPTCRRCGNELKHAGVWCDVCGVAQRN